MTRMVEVTVHGDTTVLRHVPDDVAEWMVRNWPEEARILDDESRGAEQ